MVREINQCSDEGNLAEEGAQKSVYDSTLIFSSSGGNVFTSFKRPGNQFDQILLK